MRCTNLRIYLDFTQKLVVRASSHSMQRIVVAYHRCISIALYSSVRSRVKSELPELIATTDVITSSIAIVTLNDDDVTNHKFQRRINRTATFLQQALPLVKVYFYTCTVCVIIYLSEVYKLAVKCNRERK